MLSLLLDIRLNGPRTLCVAWAWTLGLGTGVTASLWTVHNVVQLTLCALPSRLSVMNAVVNLGSNIASLKFDSLLLAGSLAVVTVNGDASVNTLVFNGLF